MVDLESGRETVRKELENVQRKMASVEDDYQKKCREHQNTLEHQARAERETADHRRNLEAALETAGAQLADMRVELGAAHGRVEALESQLSKMETSRHDAEWKLASVVSALRQTVRITAPKDVGEQKTRSRSCSPRKGLPSVLHAMICC